MSNLLIDTPENLTLEADIAGFASRFLAALIDYVLIYIGLFILFILFRPTLDLAPGNDTLNFAIIFFLQYVIFTFYHLIFEFATSGQTPGKQQLGLRVVQSNGLPVTTSGLVIRNLLRLFDFFPFAYGIGMGAMFVSKKTQRLGDLAARTVVIYERKHVTLQSVRQSARIDYRYVLQGTPLPDYIQIDRLTSNDHTMIVNFLQRRFSLNAQRGHLAQMLAQRMAAQMELNAEAQAQIQAPTESERFLEQIAFAFELRSAGETSIPNSG
ncbi:MAG: RDD family protein [Chloroflexi bacterium]|nr:RDD family protein [Chloroflexota bacterium]